MAKNVTNDERIRRLSEQDKGKLTKLVSDLYKSFHDSWSADGERRVARVKLVTECLRVYPEATSAFLIALMPWPTSENAQEHGEFRTATTGAVGRYIQMAKAHLVGNKGKKVSEKELLTIVRSQGEQATIAQLREDKVLASGKRRKPAPKKVAAGKAEQGGVGKLQELTNTVMNFKAKYGLLPAFSRELTNLHRVVVALFNEFGAMMERRDKAVGPPAGASKAA